MVNGGTVLEALFLSIHIKGNHRIKIRIFKGTLTLAIEKKKKPTHIKNKAIVKVARLKNLA